MIKQLFTVYIIFTNTCLRPIQYDYIHIISDLKIRTDDAFLLRFLRAKKFDYDRAFNLIIRHYEMKADERNKQLFTNLRPASIKHVLEAGVTGVLPNRDKFGRRVIVFRPGSIFYASRCLIDISFVSVFNYKLQALKMLGLHLDSLIIGHIFCSMLKILKNKHGKKNCKIS